MTEKIKIKPETRRQRAVYMSDRVYSAIVEAAAKMSIPVSQFITDAARRAAERVK